MKWYFILFLCLLLLLIILIFPIKLKSKVIYNLFLNKGFISIYFYALKIFVTQWKLALLKIIIMDKNNKKINIYFNNEKNDDDFKNVFFNKLVKIIKLKNFRTYARFGFNKDALITALGCGVLKSFFGGLNSYLLNKDKSENLSSQTFADFNKDRLIFCVTASVKINILMLLYCLFTAILFKIRGGKLNGN